MNPQNSLSLEVENRDGSRGWYSGQYYDIRRQVPQLQTRRQEHQQRPRCRDNLLGTSPVLDLGVYIGIGIRAGYRTVMSRSGSKRRKVAKVGAVAAGATVAVGATLVAGATVVGGILVVKAIF